MVSEVKEVEGANRPEPLNVIDPPEQKDWLQMMDCY